MRLKPVNVCQDESSHWYVIPDKMKQEFNRLLNLANSDNPGWEQAEEEFIEKFEQYRTGGDLNNVQLYADIK